MQNVEKKGFLVMVERKKLEKTHKFRDTVLVRVSRGLKEEIKGISKRTHETMSRIVDWAVEEYLKKVRKID